MKPTAAIIFALSFIHVFAHPIKKLHHESTTSLAMQEACNHDAAKNFSKPLKILFVVNIFPALEETFIVDQITGLLDRGHHVDIYSLHKGNKQKVHQKVITYTLLNRTFYKVTPKQLSSYDIFICSFGYLGPRMLSLKQRHKLPGKIVTFFRGFDLSVSIRKNPHLYDELFEHGDLFIAVCECYKDRLISLGCNPQNVVLHYDCISITDFPFEPKCLEKGKKIKILTNGRLVQKKGHLYAIEAVAQVLKKYPDVQYDIIGNGHLKKQLADLIRKHKAENHIKLIGTFTQDGIIKALRDAHIFLLASATAEHGDQETMPVVIKEAMAMGIPVISTFHSGIPELITDGESGFLAPEKDVNALAKKIGYLIAHPQIWHHITINARQVIEDRFDIEHANNQLEILLRTLVTEG